MARATLLAAGAAILLAAVAMPHGAHAGDASGVWLRENGNSKVRIGKCGDALCGSIVWLRDGEGPAKIGQRVFYDMKPAGTDQWQGAAFNPEDGKTYTGKMTLSGDTLTTKGCVFGGLICRSVSWQRSN